MKEADGANSLRWLQAARFAAALAVFLHHGAGHLRAMKGPEWLASSFRLGFAGADVFFVLSGVIMWHSTTRKSGLRDVARFASRRVTRIYSGYWPVLALCLLLMPAARASPAWDRLGSVFLTNQHHWENFIPQAWTLTFELYFYVLFSVLLFARPTRRLRWVFGAVAVLIVANGATWPRVAPFPVDAILLEFAAGIALAAVAPRLRHWRWGVVGFAGLAAAMVYVGSVGSSDVGVMRTIVFGGMAVGVVGAMLLLDLNSRVRPPAWAVHFGDSSYALYLLHGLSLHFFYWTGARDALTRRGLPVVGLFSWILLTLCASHAWYLVMERRSLALSRRAVDRLLARWLRDPAPVPLEPAVSAAAGEGRRAG